MPSGKPIKGFVFDLCPFITSGIDDASTGGSDDKLHVVVDEEFVQEFTLSRFRKDLTVITGDNFAEKYDMAKKSLE